ncbi:hypothetical protein GQ43DRAFT_343934, partial [Delitschia confertaspora ATCC 74209]
PVVVRTYSGSRHSSRPSSGLNTPRLFSGMNGSTGQSSSALSAGVEAGRDKLPSVEEFSFSAILRAVDPEIRGAIDAIAEICARSRLSLADEYDAHLPPQGEIVNNNYAGGRWGAGMGALVGRGRTRVTQGWSATENTLTAVPEASSSSEMLAGGGEGGRGRREGKGRSAYGSLKSVISGGSGKRKVVDAGTFEPPNAIENATVENEEQKPSGTNWVVTRPSSKTERPSITLITTPQASKHLSLDVSSSIIEGAAPTPVPEAVPKDELPSNATEPRSTTLHRRHTSLTSIPHSQSQTHSRGGSLSSLTSWLRWPRASDKDLSGIAEATKAENKLKEMLKGARGSG